MITSTVNPLVKEIMTLHTAKGRVKHGRCIAEGIRTIATLMQAGWKPVHIFATSTVYQDALDQLGTTSITQVSDAVMKKISTATTPSGILGVFNIPASPDPKKLSAGIVLAGIADPGNMGTLIRTCAAFDKHSVVVLEGCDPYSPKVLQSSAGTIAHVNVFRWNWQDLMKHKQSLQLICLVPEGGIAPSSLSMPECLIIIGSEAHGIPQEWIRACDYTVTIPMPGGTESLNAAVSGAIALYAIWLIKK